MADDKGSQKTNWLYGTPRQGWAHIDGIVDLGPNRAIAPEEVADHLMIHEVFYRWGIAFDDGKYDVIRSLFTEDGILEGCEGAYEPHRTTVGAAEIAKHVEIGRANQGDQRRHAISNVVIDRLEGGKALAIAYGVVTAAKPGDLILGASVIYRGELAKQPTGEWRFTKFVIAVDAYARAPGAAL